MEITTEINIGAELLTFFGNLKPIVKPPERNKLLQGMWARVLQNKDVGQKLKVYHCLSAYEKAFSEFEDRVMHVAQNHLDYADYHAYEIDGRGKQLLDIARNQALAMSYYQSGDSLEMERILLEGDRLFAEMAMEEMDIKFYITIQHYLWALYHYRYNSFQEGAKAVGIALNQWLYKVEVADIPSNMANSNAKEQVAIVHYIINGVLFCIHDMASKDVAILQEIFDGMFGPLVSKAKESALAGLGESLQLLLSYEAIDADTFIPALVRSLRVLPEAPFFVQYLLLKKLIRVMNAIEYVDRAQINNELARYFSYLGISESIKSRGNGQAFKCVN